MSVSNAARRIHEAMCNLPGVVDYPHRFGGTEYRLDRRELGHVHGDMLVDIPFPRTVRDEIVQNGEAEPHHLLATTGWVSVYLRTPTDVDRAIRLLKRSYDLTLQQRHRRPVSRFRRIDAVSE